MRALLALLCGLVVLAGCGVEPQPVPEPLPIPAPPVPEQGLPEGETSTVVTVFFVRGAELVPVERPVERVTPAEALAVLTAGPTRSEVIAGLRTALAPQPLTVDVGLPGGITSVDVTPEFTGITGGNQLLAVAQVVWTLTGLEDTNQVRFLLNGVPVEVPTDSGLTNDPVGRDHFPSVVPVPE
ncbi:GerMN domain-containing protein [Blastococcus xanthinilyticus]|uniref:Sporulation and spore germination protein n=1 Tax=Blastococcus xanthinilyticus TaxID=1564164 RepID=A0A5S5D2M8_9ACTN|nr:GerMN domain-containing protein [Blastococcus xanthinilyticus]TYP90297.1 sporulation and spore germination protein [Blastococcus xanthinilyticus]